MRAARVVFVVIASFGCAAKPPPPPPAPAAVPARPDVQSSEVVVGNTKLHYELAGSGGATVVLESGLGDGLDSWDEVFPAIARFARVVRYDRAGYGESQLGNEPRTITQIATDLHALLHGAKLPPPYVLVGHSLGGWIIRGFAHLYPDEVAGLVFVDPGTEAIFKNAPKDLVQKDAEAQEKSLQGSPGGMAEWMQMKNQLASGFTEVSAFHPPPDVPTMLMIANRDRPPGWAAAVLELYAPWVERAAAGYIVLTADSSHYIQRDEPPAVIAAVRRVVFPNALERLRRTIAHDGVAAGIALARRMKSEYPPEYLGERVLNTLGYQQLAQQHVKEAIELFALNVEMFPDRFNPYDSLGEAYMAAGDRQNALANYRKSYALNPKNTNASKMIERLQRGP
jgi:pimeloyl-ACP methyl ester carboxylesterase